MPRNSAGVYSLPASYRATTGETIVVSQHNPPFEDVAQALTDSLCADGRTAMTGPLVLFGNATANLNPITLQQFNAFIATLGDLATLDAVATGQITDGSVSEAKLTPSLRASLAVSSTPPEVLAASQAVMFATAA